MFGSGDIFDASLVYHSRRTVWDEYVVTSGSSLWLPHYSCPHCFRLGHFGRAQCKQSMKIGIATIDTTGTTIANTGIITSGMIASNVHTGTGWKNDAKNIANLRKRISNSKRNTGDGAIDIPATHGNDVRSAF